MTGEEDGALFVLITMGVLLTLAAVAALAFIGHVRQGRARDEDTPYGEVSGEDGAPGPG